MHQLIRTVSFERALAKLPHDIQELCETRLEFLSSDWRDTRLHTGKLHAKPEMYSFRITRRYRCLFYFDADNVIVIFDIDHRKDSYRKL